MKRNSSLELLRVISIVLIIGHHLGVHSNFEPNFAVNFWNEAWILFLKQGGRLGVNLFILISGYFQITRKNSNFKRLTNL